MVSDSNEQQRRASASILCEDPFPSATPYTVELIKHNIDILINHQDIRQCHFPGDQNRAEDRYELRGRSL